MLAQRTTGRSRRAYSRCSRTSSSLTCSKGPKAKNNKPPADATEPKVGPLLAEARQVVKDHPTPLLQPTPPARPPNQYNNCRCCR